MFFLAQEDARSSGHRELSYSLWSLHLLDIWSFHVTTSRTSRRKYPQSASSSFSPITRMNRLHRGAMDMARDSLVFNGPIFLSLTRILRLSLTSFRLTRRCAATLLVQVLHQPMCSQVVPPRILVTRPRRQTLGNHDLFKKNKFIHFLATLMESTRCGRYEACRR